MQCQNERSQSSNKAEAMAMLRSKLLELEERKRREEIARERCEAQDVNFGSQIRAGARRRPRRFRAFVPAEVSQVAGGRAAHSG